MGEKVECARCGTVWANSDEILDSTIAEHLKVTGHRPELD